jgi:CubicO group peptidase (beta-lactamase class C family)
MQTRQLSIVFGLAAFVFFTGKILATDFDKEKLSQLPVKMQEFVDKQHLAGVVTVVGTKDGIVQISAVGSLDIETKKPMPQDGLFRIASMTKPITALAIMMLVDEGKLSVDDPVEQHLPEFRGQMLVTAREQGTVTLKKPPRPIAIRDLLTHTSGLPGGFPEGLSDLYLRRNLTLKEAVFVSSQRPLDFEPGSKWSYCNAGIDTLGRIVEVASGEGFESFLAKRIFQPLGMKDTSFYPTSEQMTRLARTYDRQNEHLVLKEWTVVGAPENARHPVPAGGLFSTAADLSKLYAMLLNDGQVQDKRLVSSKNLAEMTRVQTGDLVCGFVSGMSFGYGFAVVREPQGITGMLSPGTFGHGGAFGTQAWIDPHRGVFVILLIQRVGMQNSDGSDMRLALQTIAFDAIK